MVVKLWGIAMVKCACENMHTIEGVVQRVESGGLQPASIEETASIQLREREPK